MLHPSQCTSCALEEAKLASIVLLAAGALAQVTGLVQPLMDLVLLALDQVPCQAPHQGELALVHHPLEVQGMLT